jgi:hypothetical protein
MFTGNLLCPFFAVAFTCAQWFAINKYINDVFLFVATAAVANGFKLKVPFVFLNPDEEFAFIINMVFANFF